MIFSRIKKITGLLMMTLAISLAIFAGEQGQPQQQDPPKNPPQIPVGNKERPNQNRGTENKNNPPKNNENKPKKP
jgi:stringent starvation protein B